MKTKEILSSVQQGILICDRFGRIIYCNRAYAKFIGKPEASILGQPLKKIRPHAFATKVLHSQKPIENIYREEDGKAYFANIYPIMENGTISGTISLITLIAEAQLQDESLGMTLKERTRRFEQQEIRKLLRIYGTDLEGKKQTAKALGISLSGLYAKLQADPKPEHEG